MTKPMMDLGARVEKSADVELLREMIGCAAKRLMELEVGAKTGADYGEKSGDRLTPRYGMFTARVLWRRDSGLKSGTVQSRPTSRSRLSTTPVRQWA